MKVLNYFGDKVIFGENLLESGQIISNEHPQNIEFYDTRNVLLYIYSP